MKLTLYYAPVACSLVPLVALHESGADFDVKPISLKNKQQHDAEYLRINPKARYCGVPGSEESIRKLALEDVIKNFRIVNGMLAGKEWTFDHWTAVDAYLFWVWRRFGVFKIEIPPFPNYADHGERMMKRDSVKRALAFEREVQAQAEKAA